MVLNCNSNVPQGGIYPHINFERDPLNIFELTSSESTGGRGGGGGGGGGGDANTIISPNTSFGDIIMWKIANISRQSGHRLACKL